jgi:hypothetical protein
MDVTWEKQCAGLYALDPVSSGEVGLPVLASCEYGDKHAACVERMKPPGQLTHCKLLKGPLPMKLVTQTNKLRGP